MVAIIALKIYRCPYLKKKKHSIGKGSVFYPTLWPHADIPEGSDLQKLLLMWIESLQSLQSKDFSIHCEIDVLTESVSREADQ